MFNLEARDRRSLAAAFGERALDLSRFRTRTERKRANNGLEEELYVLRRYLFTLESEGLLRYPLQLSKGETPDFVLSVNEAEFGIEISEATWSGDQREMTLAERSGEPTLLGTYGGRYKGGIRDAGPPDRGRRADRDLTSDVLRAIRRKRALGYITPAVDLVLYANGNANMMADFATFLPLVSGRLARWGAALTKGTKIRNLAIMKDRKLILWNASGRTIVIDLHDSLPA